MNGLVEIMKYKQFRQRARSTSGEALMLNRSARVAARDGWQVWEDNDAVEVLLLTPRFVFTDKHDGLQTQS